ncbi:flagellar biosynthesis anti-sigma factor FlgM [Bordetella genomosp. 8]|uniref:Negative regulator of flagellin synthesis n=1 Tax=Bordetella genomosp. 8 TaxID=1416806 RepID=A0A1W6YK54_9BORD|nr:flagellar biosynthesis anti-sigma factor FlgM [Bordetella genomosp. 8]
MKINSSTTRPSTTPAETTGARSAVAQAYGGVAGGGSSSAQVDLSPMSRKLIDLQNGAGDIDTAKVQAIRDAIAAGQLKIDPTKIADGLIASAQELLK